MSDRIEGDDQSCQVLNWPTSQRVKLQTGPMDLDPTFIFDRCLQCGMLVKAVWATAFRYGFRKFTDLGGATNKRYLKKSITISSTAGGETTVTTASLVINPLNGQLTVTYSPELREFYPAFQQWDELPPDNPDYPLYDSITVTDFSWHGVSEDEFASIDVHILIDGDSENTDADLQGNLTALLDAVTFDKLNWDERAITGYWGGFLQITPGMPGTYLGGGYFELNPFDNTKEAVWPGDTFESNVGSVAGPPIAPDIAWVADDVSGLQVARTLAAGNGLFFGGGNPIQLQVGETTGMVVHAQKSQIAWGGKYTIETITKRVPTGPADFDVEVSNSQGDASVLGCGDGVTVVETHPVPLQFETAGVIATAQVFVPHAETSPTANGFPSRCYACKEYLNQNIRPIGLSLGGDQTNMFQFLIPVTAAPLRYEIRIEPNNYTVGALPNLAMYLRWSQPPNFEDYDLRKTGNVMILPDDLPFAFETAYAYLGIANPTSSPVHCQIHIKGYYQCV